MSNLRVGLSLEVFQIMQEAPDPERTAAVIVDIVSRLVAGEDEDSIAKIYSAELEEIKARRKARKGGNANG